MFKRGSSSDDGLIVHLLKMLNDEVKLQRSKRPIGVLIDASLVRETKLNWNIGQIKDTFEMIFIDIIFPPLFFLSLWLFASICWSFC